MRATINEIAKICGVSRGTVDRVINGRAGVSKQTANKIQAALKELDYKPNAIGKALVSLKNPIRLGVIVSPAYNPFVGDIKVGIRKAANELHAFGVRIETVSMVTLKPEEQVAIIDKFVKRGVNGISLLPIESDLVEEATRRAISSGVRVITFNSDLPMVRRLCFVGQDHIAGGRVVGNLMGKIIGSGGVAIITSSQHILCHVQRMAGFRELLIERYSEINVLEVVENEDRDDLAFDLAVDLIKRFPDLRGIYLTGGGSAGLGKALLEFGLGGKVRVITHDLVSDTVKLIQDGVFDFTIGQDPVAQGYLPLKLLYAHLQDGSLPSDSFIRTSIDIRTLGNLEVTGCSIT